jgi:leucyl aminopeptidase (aminopeptidase T)
MAAFVGRASISLECDPVRAKFDAELIIRYQPENGNEVSVAVPVKDVPLTRAASKQLYDALNEQLKSLGKELQGETGVWT